MIGRDVYEHNRVWDKTTNILMYVLKIISTNFKLPISMKIIILSLQRDTLFSLLYHIDFKENII